MVIVDDSDLNHGYYEWQACVAFCVIIPVFLILRFYSRLVAKQLGSDDWAALGAACFAVSCNLQTIIAINDGWGRHLINLTPDQITITLLLHWSFQITYKLTVALNKISILLLYLRIMPQQMYRYAIFFLLTLVSLFCIATTIAGVFQCLPVEKAWHKNMEGSCYNLVAAWYTNAVFSIVTDFVILFLPMHMVYRLQRDKREKILLYFIFGIGGFVTFTSIMRFFALKDASSKDTTYDVNSGFWSVIEINIGVICICLPPLRAALSRHLFFIPPSPSSSNPFSLSSPSSKKHHNHRRHPLGYVKTDPVASSTSGNSEPRERERVRAEAEESEEELVLMGTWGWRKGVSGSPDAGIGVERGIEMGSERGMGMGMEGGIKKTMEFKVTQTEMIGDVEVEVERPARVVRRDEERERGRGRRRDDGERGMV